MRDLKRYGAKFIWVSYGITRTKNYWKIIRFSKNCWINAGNSCRAVADRTNLNCLLGHSTQYTHSFATFVTSETIIEYYILVRKLAHSKLRQKNSQWMLTGSPTTLYDSFGISRTDSFWLADVHHWSFSSKNSITGVGILRVAFREDKISGACSPLLFTKYSFPCVPSRMPADSDYL